MNDSWLKETMAMVEGWQQEKSMLEGELEETKVEIEQHCQVICWDCHSQTF